jgi:hypothetical protein
LPIGGILRRLALGSCSAIIRVRSTPILKAAGLIDIVQYFGIYLIDDFVIRPGILIFISASDPPIRRIFHSIVAARQRPTSNPAFPADCQQLNNIPSAFTTAPNSPPGTEHIWQVVFMLGRTRWKPASMAAFVF